MVLADEGYMDLLTSGPHLVVHFALDIFSGLILYPLLKRAWAKAKEAAIKEHDETFHPHDHDGA